MKRSKKIIITFLAAVTILFCFAGCNESTIEKQEKQISNLEEKNYYYNDEIRDLEVERDNLESEIDDLLEQIDELNEQIAGMEENYYFYDDYVACVNDTGSYYHHPDCDYFDDSSFYIYNTDLAEAKGYKPCPVCW